MHLGAVDHHLEAGRSARDGANRIPILVNPGGLAQDDGVDIAQQPFACQDSTRRYVLPYSSSALKMKLIFPVHRSA